MDWVYRSRQYLDDGSTTSVSPGGWSPASNTLNSGATNSVALILVDSANFTTKNLTPNAAVAESGFVMGPARVDGRGQLIGAVQGHVFITPSTWAVGNILSVGIRLTIAEQDVDDGIPELDADYAINRPAAAAVPANDLTLFANQQGSLKDWYVYRQFADNSAVIVVSIFWKGKRRLRPEECLFLHLEGNSPFESGGAVNCSVSSHVRTLVARE